MRVTTAIRAWMTVKPHVPLIKFRKGGLQASDPRLTGAHGGPNVPSHGSPSGAPPGPGKTVQKPIIEDYQLPPKYRRAPLSEQEIEYINRGGPE
ncbi:hypothetical protein R5R35_000883 [Gryllus longicercus]|uniref:Mitochondrial ribosomal protein S36 n=1 Tax=Gryllus longicercus TaxID=2509291 RepID=A0AAN9VW98_9ORTH